MAHRIALVDDDPPILRLFGQYLSSLGHDYQGFSCGADLLQALENGACFDLFILDVMMPRMTGFEICERIRALDAHRFSPVLFMTAMDDEDAQQNAVRVGADDLLIKPVRRAELGLRVAALLRLKRAQSELAEKNAELARIEQQRHLFTSMLVHDLKSPLLSTVMNLSFAMEETEEIPAVHQAIADAIDTTWRIQRRVHSMLAIAKSEAAGLQTRLEEVPLRSILATFVASQRKQAAAVGVALRLECGPETRACIDRELFTRMLENLLDNALRYSPKNTTIVVRAEALAKERTCVAVIDQGPGIAQDKARTIFEPFTQGDDVEHASANVGLGLAFCRVAAQAQRGHIEALPGDDGKGTCMRLTVPSA